MIRREESEIMIVGYDSLTRKLLEDGYHVTEYNDVKEAVEGLIFRLSNQFPMPNVVVCNYGVETPEFGNIQRLTKPKNIPLIVLDQSATVGRRDRALSHEVYDYLNTKVGLERLIFRIETVANVNRTTNRRKYIRPGFSIPLSKRVFDIMVSGLLLVLLSPLFLLVMLAIRLESNGPVFYWQPRVGSGYRVFKFYKFRSMRVNADQLVDQLKGQNHYRQTPTEAQSIVREGAVLVGDNQVQYEQQHLINKQDEEKNSFFKVKNDPRITLVGHFIRNTSIDELPQLLNVLIGDMSIVGNRPLPLYEAEKLTDDYWSERFMAPAGITGLWQVTERGKSGTSDDSRKRLDIEYARTFNFWLDMKILLKTPLAALQHDNV